MPMYTTDANRAFLPEQVGQLVVQPVIAQAVATQAATVVPISAAVDSFRVPIVAEDPTAAWVAEGQEIPPSDAVLDEVATTFSKLAGLTIISRELAEDSSPAAATLVGQGLARDIARKLDGAYFGDVAAPAPAGLGALTGVTTVDAGDWANLDPFEEAIAAAAAVGATLTAFVANPAVALGIATIKTATDSNAHLLQADPTQPTRRMIAGVPLYSSPAVAPDTVWGLPRDRALIALREGTTLAVDRSAFFTSDRIAVRATLRVAFAFPHEEAVVKITPAVVTP
jgi:HK97 family phage major capsid protein